MYSDTICDLCKSAYIYIECNCCDLAVCYKEARFLEKHGDICINCWDTLPEDDFNEIEKKEAGIS